MPKPKKKKKDKPKRLGEIEKDIDSIEIILTRMYAEIEVVRDLLKHIAESRQGRFFGDK